MKQRPSTIRARLFSYRRARRRVFALLPRIARLSLSASDVAARLHLDPDDVAVAMRAARAYRNARK